MAFIILISNAWGVALKEWKGVDRATYRSIIGGIVTIIISICIVGFAKTLEN
jgi:L-rhamnose-H+ transport protein